MSVLGTEILSLVSSFLAVTLPQVAALLVWRYQLPQTMFSLAMGKFLVSVLLLIIAARVLHETGLWVSEYFIAGTFLAIIVNIMALIKRTRIV